MLGSKKKSGKSPQATQPFEIVGENVQNDDFDIDYLRKVDFSQVDELEPNAQESFHLAL
jgi:hypothetical protein